MIKKYTDWRGWLNGLYRNWIKSLTTSLMAYGGTNVAETVGLKGIGITWEQAIGLLVSVTFWEVVKYLNANAEPVEKEVKEDEKVGVS